MLGPTDGNLYALAEYQRKVDEDAERDAAIERVLNNNPDWDEDQALSYLEGLRYDAEESRAEMIAEARAERAERYW